ncbi:MAG: ABC transporter ATP-binding protein [Ilumatobacteraceae bacterium]|nr:ABC transporter ATP-binding protein [Ilumatobacteraceae bacterium]
MTNESNGGEDVALRTSGLTKRFGDHAAVRSIDLEVRTGEIFGLLGPNGSGKSTTMRMLAGLIRASSGEAVVLGAEPGAQPTRVGAMIEEPALYPYLSGRRNLSMLGRLVGADDEAVTRQLDVVGLGEAADRVAGGYSTGMRQRLGVACSLIHDPELLLLDEPSAGLDPSGVVEIRELLGELGAQGRTIVVSSHMLTEIERVCDRVAVLSNGELVFQGDLDELRRRDGDELVARVAQVDMAVRALAELGVDVRHDGNGDELVILASPHQAPEITRSLVAAGVDVFAISERRRSLEESYMELTST